MSEPLRNDKESMICLTPKPSKNFFVYRIQSEEFFLRKKDFFLRKRGSGGLTKKRKEGFFNCSRNGDLEGLQNVTKKT